MKLGIFHFQVLYNVLDNIHFIYDEDELANNVLKKVSEALNAEAGTIFKLLPDDSIIPLAAYGTSLDVLKKMKFTVGNGVVGWVAQYVQPVKVDNPKSDTRFHGAIDTVTGFQTRSIIAAPILTKGKPIGIIEFLNRQGGPFAIPDLELISMIGREIGIAFENVTLIKQLEEARAFQESIINSLSAGVLVLDRHDRLIEVNPTARKILGAGINYVTGSPLPLELGLPAYPELIAVLRSATVSESALTRQELTMKIAGRACVIGYSCVPIKAPKGDRVGTVLLFQDITQYVSGSPGAK